MISRTKVKQEYHSTFPVKDPAYMYYKVVYIHVFTIVYSRTSE